jgi:Holliday junction resolvase RusA-like endonuclease
LSGYLTAQTAFSDFVPTKTKKTKGRKVEIQLDIPMPPSVNSIWRHAGKRSYRSPRYIKWIERTDVHVMAYGQWPKERIDGRFTAEFLFDEALVRKGSDIDNRVKPAMDWCVRRQLIIDDRYCRKITAEWATRSEAPHGCRVILRSYHS